MLFNEFPNLSEEEKDNLLAEYEAELEGDGFQDHDIPEDFEEEIVPKFVYSWNTDSTHKPEKIISEIYSMYEVGDIVCLSIAAPGYGHISMKVTRKDDSGLYGEQY